MPTPPAICRCAEVRGGSGKAVSEPFFIAGPGITPRVCETTVIGTDFYPTLLDLCGLPFRPAQHVDGVTLRPLLQTGRFPDRDLFWHYPHHGNQGGEPSSIIRRGPWKLIHYWEDGHRELYNLLKDKAETTDLSDTHSDLVVTLSETLEDGLQVVNATIPRPDPRFDPVRKQANDRKVCEQLKPGLERQHARMLEPDFVPDPTWWGSLPTND